MNYDPTLIRQYIEAAIACQPTEGQAATLQMLIGEHGVDLVPVGDYALRIEISDLGIPICQMPQTSVQGEFDTASGDIYSTPDGWTVAPSYDLPPL